MCETCKRVEDWSTRAFRKRRAPLLASGWPCTLLQRKRTQDTLKITQDTNQIHWKIYRDVYKEGGKSPFKAQNTLIRNDEVVYALAGRVRAFRGEEMVHEYVLSNPGGRFGSGPRRGAVPGATGGPKGSNRAPGGGGSNLGAPMPP